MKIEVTSPDSKLAEAVRQHLGLSSHSYELWFLGDVVGKPLPKNRDNLNTLLKEAHQLLTDAVAAEPTLNYGEAEIVRRWNELGEEMHYDETVWSMSIDEFKKGHRLPIKAI